MALSVSSASLKLDLAGTVSKEENLVNVIPALAPFRRFPVVRAFTDSVKLRGELSPSVVFNTTWKQDPMTRDLVFNEATGTIGISLKAIINARINDHFKFQGWVAGGGKLVIKTPSPYLLSASINFEAGAQLKIDGLFGGQELKAKVNYGCKITTAANAATCESSNSSNLLSGDNYFNPKLKLLRPEYEQFGQYESFKPADNRFDKPNADKTESPIDSMINETIVSNVFGNAEPTILPVGGSGKLLLWVRQNPNLPVLQSTDIVWSYYDGSSWTAPAVITSDTRAEFSPVAGVDANGKVTAAWLKIKTPAFDTPVPTLDDLPVYYKQVEVISAVFDPVTRAWSSETSLTNDSALDTSLRMAKDNSGNLLLTWQSNPSGEFTADSANPATLKYSFRNGSGWNAPAAVAGNLSNISEQAVALKGNNAFIVLPYDPDPNAVNDGKLLIYNWNGGNWSAGSVFAADNVDNVLPAAVYDTSGKGQIIWQKGANLVQANTTNSSPQIVREGSQSAAFHNIRLLNNGRDNLTLTWQEVVDNAPANIFGKFYDPSSNKWGEDRRLNQTDWQSKDVSGYYDARGNLQLVYLATQILRVTETVTINGQNYQIENVPEDGQTDLRLLTVNQAKPIFDFDGDGKSEIGIFRPSAAEWWYQRSIDGATRAVQFGSPNDIRVTPADFTGDGRTDIAFFRPSDGNWFVIRSEDSTYFAFPFGSNGDIPAPADFDGDGKADAAVFRPSQGVWYVNKSSGGTSITQFGIAEDKPVVADYDGDAKADIAIFRPSNNSWWHVRSSDGEFRVYQFALGTDKPVIGDWTGDGKADLATYRPTTGEWFIRKSEDLSYYAVPFGAAGDIPAPGDYDGDGKLDTAVYRPTQRTWYINRSTVGILITQFGIEEDKPLEASFIP